MFDHDDSVRILPHGRTSEYFSMLAAPKHTLGIQIGLNPDQVVYCGTVRLVATMGTDMYAGNTIEALHVYCLTEIASIARREKGSSSPDAKQEWAASIARREKGSSSPDAKHEWVSETVFLQWLAGAEGPNVAEVIEPELRDIGDVSRRAAVNNLIPLYRCGRFLTWRDVGLLHSQCVLAKSP
jgi:hypothetical protein